jgi:phosphatidylinositol alpha 1,6-mannosyltransferase
MRVAIFAETFLPKWDGITNTLCRLLEHLEREGHESILFAPEGAPTSYAGTKIHGFPAFACPWYNDLRLATPLGTATKELENFDPDLIHVASPLLLGALGLKKARQMGVPVVASYHTDVPGYMELYGFGALREPSWALLRWLHNQADLNVCPSTHTMRQLRAKGFERLGLWARGIDAQKYTPARFGFTWRDRLSNGHPDAPLLLYVGRLAVEKRLELLRPVLDAIPEARLALVGSGPEEASLRELFAGTNTEFVGYLKGDDLADAYAAADFFVFPSENETFGNVVLEAMASGLTVVAAAEGGPLDLVEHGENGFLFTPGRVDEMVAVLRWMIATPAFSKQVGQRARRFAESRSWESIMSGLVVQYEELVTARRAVLAG